MFCKDCGRENGMDAAFCIGCGRPLQGNVIGVIGQSDGPTAVFTAPKKKNIAALALGALSIILAIALVLSMTGVLGVAGGSPGGAVASKSFGSPEDAINYFTDCLKAGDFEGALSACAINEMAEGFDYKAYAERMKLLPPLTMSYMPSEYEQYVLYNKNRLEQQILMQMTCFTISFSLSEDYAGLIDSQTISLQDGKLPDGLIEQFDPSILSGLEVVKVGKMSIHDDERNRENQKKMAKPFDADDMQFRTVLYKLDGAYYAGGFTVLEYNGRWLIQNMSDPLAGISSFGTPIPVADKSDFDSMME